MGQMGRMGQMGTAPGNAVKERREARDALDNKRANGLSGRNKQGQATPGDACLSRCVSVREVDSGGFREREAPEPPPLDGAAHNWAQSFLRSLLGGPTDLATDGRAACRNESRPVRRGARVTPEF